MVEDDGWRIPDQVWARMEPLLPPRPSHPLGCHNPRVPDRDAMNAILLVLRTGMQWNALDATGIIDRTSRIVLNLGDVGAQQFERRSIGPLVVGPIRVKPPRPY